MAKVRGNYTDFIDFSRSSSATYLDSDGLIKTAADNVPRVEYDANGVLKGLLIEEARTNLIPESNSLTIAMGRAEGSPISSPDGSNDGNEYRVSGSSGAIYIYPNGSVTSGVSYTFSTWVRRTTKTPNAGCDFAKISCQTNFASAQVVFDLVSGSVVGTPTMPSYSIEAFSNGWYRITATSVATATGSGFSFILWPSKNALGSKLDIAADGLSIGDYVFDVWGAQLEAGSFPTSYIPTSGATATRSADIASISVDNFGYNQKAGTVVVEFGSLVPLGSRTNDGIFSLELDSDDLHRVYMASNDALNWQMRVGATTVFASPLVNTAAQDQQYKFSASWESGAQDASVDGASATSFGTSSDVPDAATTLKIGYINTSDYLNGHIKSLKYIPRRNTNTQLQEFTS